MYISLVIPFQRPFKKKSENKRSVQSTFVLCKNVYILFVSFEID